MYDALVFYNHFGNGDLFESREFIKELMGKIPADEYFYAHGKNQRMFADIPNLKWTPVTDAMRGDKGFVRCGPSLYINTWIGRDSRYVLPRVGCVVDKNIQMFNDILKESGHGTLTGQLEDYLPQPDFKFFHTKDINSFLKKHKEKKVLICNGWVGSMQSENFDMTMPIVHLAESLPDVAFLVTTPLENVDVDNIYNTSDIIKSPDGFDLNEISYLAESVNVIIGRKSGPFVFAHTKNVWMSADKVSLSFTYEKHSSHFVRQDHLPLRKAWSPATSAEQVFEEMRKVI